MKKKVKSGKFKGSPSKFKTKAKYVKQEKKPNDKIYNRADSTLDKMIGQKGFPRKKVGLK